MHEEQVRKGIAVLDETTPTWRDQVDKRVLDLASWGYCILGQVYGDYGQGLDMLTGRYLPAFSALSAWEARCAFARDHGFNADDTGDHEPLTDAWLEALA